MRVMQSFGEPRATTNPYIVMLRDALSAHRSVQHVPFSWQTALFGRFDVFHVHWADTLLAGSHWWTRAGKRVAFAAFLIRLRVTRTAVVRTVHNVAARGGGRVSGMLTSSLERMARVEIHLNRSTPSRAGMLSVFVPHGHYRSWYARFPTRDRRPEQLAYVGLIKPYKGVDELVARFGEAHVTAPALRLDISGRVTDAALRADLERAAASVHALSVDLRYLDEAQFVAAVTKASLVVLPYRELHNSGIALAALSLDRAVLVPDNEVTRELAREVGDRWVQRFTAPLAAGDLIRALGAVDSVAPAEQTSPNLSARDWDGVADLHVDAYTRALNVRGLRSRARKNRTS